MTAQTALPGKRRRWAVMERFAIGRQDNPMMVRWRLVQTPLFGVYLHFIHREDLDRDPHDHPWKFASLVLRGGYSEELSRRPRNLASEPEEVWHGMGSLHRFPLRHAHRITRVKPGTVTLVLVGRKSRQWGFFVDGRWVQWTDYDYRGLMA